MRERKYRLPIVAAWERRAPCNYIHDTRLLWRRIDMAMEIIDAEQAHSLSLEIANLLGVVRATDSLAIMGAKE